MRCLLILAFLYSLKLSAVPESGVWSCGGSGNYSFFPGTYIGVNDIEMDSIRVLAQLYPGFAVIKGTYFLKNTGSDTIKLTAGFPSASEFDVSAGYYQLRTSFAENYYLKILEDDSLITSSESGHWYSPEHEEAHDWNLWTNTLPPNSITKVEIYTIVSTNNSSMSSGWSESDDNVFAYILECGLWSSNIRTGSVTIQLMDGVDEDEFRGFTPDSRFTYYPDNRILYWSFGALGMTDGRYNIVFPYGERLRKFHFYEILVNPAQYITAIDKLDYIASSGTGELFSIGDPLNFESGLDNPILIILMLIIFVLAGIVLAVIFRNRKTRIR